MPSEDFNHYSNNNPETRLFNSIETKTNSLNTALNKVVAQLTKGAKKIVKTLLSENKILVCANGPATILAQYLAAEFINRFETDRPALPAFSLTSDNVVIASITNDTHYNDIFSRQIQGLGKAHDMLFIFVSNELSNSLVKAIESAHEQEMQVILIAGEISEDISHYINKTDICIQLALENQAQILEAQLLCIHSICDLVDHLLFGTA